MIGLELYINGERISAVLESGVVSLIATQISKSNENSIELDLKGLNTSDSTEGEKIDWYNKKLSEGDEFFVKIKDIAKCSTPIKKENHNPDIGKNE